MPLYFSLSLQVIVGPIFSSHVFVVISTLGWNDKISTFFQVKGVDCDCYVKCGEVINWLGAPTSQTSNPTLQNPSWFQIPQLQRMYNLTCHNIIHFCINMAISIESVVDMKDGMEKVGVTRKNILVLQMPNRKSMSGN